VATHRRLDVGTVKTHSHQKCDAKQPCTTCVTRDRAVTCKYEGSRSSANVPPQTSPPRDVLLPSWTDSSEAGSSHSLSPESRGRSSTPPRQLKWQPSPHVLDQVPPVPCLDALAVEENSGITDCPPCPTESSFAISPLILFHAIPRPLGVTFSLVPPERMQVSCAPGSDLDMTLYVSLSFLNGQEGLKP
jgi:hypothetical protein